MNRNATEPDAPVLVLHWGVLEEVIKTIGMVKAESGGAIGGYDGSTEVSRYHFDESSRNSAVTYSPDYQLLNRLFKSDWNPKGVRLRGFIHSHPGLMGRPSFGDEAYAERIHKAIPDLGCLWLPIASSISDTGEFHFIPWAVYPTQGGVSVVRGKIKVVHAPAKSTLEVSGESVLEAIQNGVELDEIVVGRTKRFVTSGRKSFPHSFETEGMKITRPEATFNMQNTFNRVVDAYDLKLMRSSRIITVGAGGAASWLEEMARTGLGQFVIIDPDTVSETNLATQQTYRRDINRPKVEAIAERLRDINPTAKIITLQKSLDDLSDDEIRQLAYDPINGCKTCQTVICGLTDEFTAQARVNKLALQLGLPSLCAQVYREGRGAEITFTYPGVTPACHRCILSTRYQHFLENGQKNDVTSHGTPIFSTTRLNAIKGFLTLALLHHGTDHPRWGKMLSRIGKRNLVQIRMDPDFTKTMGMTVFDRVFDKADGDRLFFDEVVWLPQDQECPDTGYPFCPDCGGTGNLGDAVGKIEDTRDITSANKVERTKRTA